MGYALVAIYAAIPIVTLAADNGRLVSLSEVLPYYLAVVLPALAATIVVRVWKGSTTARRFGLCTAVAVTFTFDYHQLRPALSAMTHGTAVSMVFIWAAALMAILLVVAKLGRRFERAPMVALAVGLAILAPEMLRYVRYHTPRPAGNEVARADANTPRTAIGDRAPNVYYFLLDAYGRPDRLRKFFHFDDAPFVATLKNSGFVIPPETESAYGVTALSAGSIVEMRYVDRGGTFDWQAAVPWQSGSNAVITAFRSLGYSIALAPSEFVRWKCSGDEDLCIHPTPSSRSEIGLSDMDWAVLDLTPFADILQSAFRSEGPGFAPGRQFPLRNVELATARPRRRPLFLYSHVLLPHPPFLYGGPRCNFIPRSEERWGSAAYRRALTCTNRQIEDVVAYLKRNDPDAVIVLASDHGADVDMPEQTAEWEWPQIRIDRRFSNFVALKLPTRCRSSVPDDLHAVNIFRVVLNCLSAPRVRLLQPRRYLIDVMNQTVRPARGPVNR